jgi:hypothetical protein
MAALLLLVGLEGCATSPEIAAKISLAKAASDLTEVPDYDLCSASVKATAPVVAERKRRGLADCTLYLKTYTDAYNAADVIRGGWFGLMLSPVVVGLAARDRKIISSPTCPFNPDVLTGAGAWTYQRKPGCPRYAADG